MTAVTPPYAPRRQPSNAIPTPAPNAPRILIVEDEEAVRGAFHRFLRSRGYDVRVVETAEAGLEALASERFTVALFDIYLPGMTGIEAVPAALTTDPELAIIMLTAVDDAMTATAAIGRGATDYLVKPVELADLDGAVKRAVHKRTLQIEQQRVERLIREEVVARTAELEKEKQALRELTMNIARSLINAMEAKDLYLRGHSHRVAELGATIAEEMGLDADTVEHVRLAGQLHDVGKIGIRESVLNKPDKLTAQEFEHVKDHVRMGMEILAPLTHLDRVLGFVHDHHEHWDGVGYPRRLKGEEISIGGRILAAADAFDAVTSRRAYREALTQAAAVEYLQTHVGTLLDPAVYQALRTVVERRGALEYIDVDVKEEN
jgi:response regulator RpfG family c-di-GMP phosphodiesterase